jgi:hypothetical protein
METTKLNGTEYTLTEGEGGKITLTPLIKQPEKRTPEAGDVWADNEGFVHFISASGKGVDLISGHISFEKYSQYPTNSSDTYLGKFDEVYVKIADVREALSHEDYDGDSILNGFPESAVGDSGLEPSRKALRKLNIITD